jgi:hypothetical protein
MEVDVLLSHDNSATVICEMSNPGPVGQDTGYVFKDPKTGETIRVVAQVGESREDAIARVRERHGL